MVATALTIRRTHSESLIPRAKETIIRITLRDSRVSFTGKDVKLKNREFALKSCADQNIQRRWQRRRPGDGQHRRGYRHQQHPRATIIGHSDANWRESVPGETIKIIIVVYTAHAAAHEE